MSEFDLIRRYFTRATPGALLGVGDDAALLQASAGNVLAVSTDMLVSGTHFLPDADPFLLGHKTLAVNLSDMAAMGAAPRWATLAIALPLVQGKETSHERPHPNPPPEGEGTNESLREFMFTVDEAWLAQFSAGFFSIAQQHGVELVGGDTTRGSLNLCVTIFGEVPAQQALHRSGAQAGDEIWVSGCLGDAALALAHLQGRITLSAAELAACAPALHQPQPRVALGLALRGIASSAIDVSDGLLADLGHTLEASQVGAEIGFAALPVSAVLREYLTPGVTTSHSTRPSAEELLAGHPKDDDQVAGYDKGRPGGVELLQQCILCGGDDYELCFTAPAARHTELLSIAARLDLPLACIGKVVAGRGCIVHDASGNPLNIEACGYDHFR
ncbi:MAG: thiamine-monophosphate kinase [Nitrosomonadales bacterium]|nr:thiamine-monophosphate kinase [Nitrosomonadales bacterium]